MGKEKKLPKIGLLYLDYVLRFFDKSNFRGWPDKIEIVTYHWKNDKERFIKEVKRKKIDILIGNVPATAYETFREISRALPNVQFVPSMDTQFSNKSKENVTRFCEKYDIPIPKTTIIYNPKKAIAHLNKIEYPKIIKKSYGPSNYGGYFVHKVDSKKEAIDLITTKKYHPLYIQDFVPMSADIRVMLIGHKPVCAFWRRPPEGEWLTNTSQGGSMDYNNVPKEVLDLAVKVSKAAKAEYWACDIAVGVDGKFRLLECATAFAAFPYIRDWIGQYLMWKFSEGKFKKPNIPLYNWEELGKIDSSLLRTMRYITFGKYSPSFDGEYYTKKTQKFDKKFEMGNTAAPNKEEWPSEVFNYQDKLRPSFFNDKKDAVKYIKDVLEKISDNDEDADTQEISSEKEALQLNEKELTKFFKSIDGIGKKLAKSIVEEFGTSDLVNILDNDPEKLRKIKGIKEKKIKKICKTWEELKKDLK